MTLIKENKEISKIQAKKQIKIDPFHTKRKVLEGSREKILEVLKSSAKPGCKKCYGRGYIHYTENKDTSSRQYAPCPKCIND